MKRRNPSIKETCSEVVRGVYISHLDDPSKNFRVAELCKGSRNTRNLQYLSAYKNCIVTKKLRLRKHYIFLTSTKEKSV